MLNSEDRLTLTARPLRGLRRCGRLRQAGTLPPVVKTLLKHGASVNNATLTNSTPLRAACFDGHLEIVRYLVEHRADMEVANRHGHTCLMISCYKGHKEIAKFLLDRGADVNRKSVKGNTALHDCAESGSLDIMKMLLKCNARMERDGYGMTPLLAASVTGHTNIVEYLAHQPRTSREECIDALELLGHRLPYRGLISEEIEMLCALLQLFFKHCSACLVHLVLNSRCGRNRLHCSY
uniref:Uncharacterized protein n=1 Tax=Monopterus albus TaxID=43700 RepID=A0A3Q3KDH2_MONAL